MFDKVLNTSLISWIELAQTQETERRHENVVKKS